VEFWKYSRHHYDIIVKLASQAGISRASKGGDCRDGGQKPKETHGKNQPRQQKQQKAMVNTVSQQPAEPLLQRAHPCCLGR
jgi:hypothetical protein